MAYTERQFTRYKQHKEEIKNNQPPDHIGVRDIQMHVSHSSHCFHIYEIIKTFLSPLSPRFASPGYNKQGWINCTIHWWTKWNKVLLLKCFVLNSGHINSDYGSRCINDNESLSQAEWECWREQRHPRAAASKQSLSFNWDSGICFHNKQFSFDRYLSWQKSILCTSHTALSQQYGYSLSSHPKCHIFLSFMLKSSHSLTLLEPLALISFDTTTSVDRGRTSLQDTKMKVKWSSCVMWQ